MYLTNIRHQITARLKTAKFYGESENRLAIIDIEYEMKVGLSKEKILLFDELLKQYEIIYSKTRDDVANFIFDAIKQSLE